VGVALQVIAFASGSYTLAAAYDPEIAPAATTINESTTIVVEEIPPSISSPDLPKTDPAGPSQQQADP
jgi:hypothetical protein